MPNDEGEEKGVAMWVRRWWRALAAEVLATALLVALGVGALVPLPGQEVYLTHPALAFGCVVVGNAAALGAVSGAHMNPAVTLAALLAGRLRAAPAAAYVLAQLLGAVLGFGALLATLPVARPVGCTLPAAAVTPPAAAALEAAMTAALALACCGLWAAHDPLRPDHSAPIKLGLLVAGLVYAGGSATGASLNPARSLAPALLHGHWDHHWVYWVGPLGGAALAAAAHRWVLARPATPPARRAPEDLPLHDKP